MNARKATGFVLPAERIDVLAGLVWRFERVPGVRELVALLLGQQE